MEPVTILVSALSLVGTALSPVADQAVKDGYAGLKALLVRKFGGSQPKLAQVLDQHEEDPELYRPTVETVLKRAGADRDQELVDQATELLKRAEAAQPGVTGGLVGQINAQGGRVSVIHGDVHGGLVMGDLHGDVRPPS